MSSLTSIPNLMSTEPYNGQITSNLLTTGDLVKYRHKHLFGQIESYIGEIVDIDNDIVSIHVLEQQSEYNGKLWMFNHTEHEILASTLTSLVKPERPLTRKTMKAAWGMMGYVVGVERFCLIEDEKHVTLDVHPQDSDSEDDENDSDYIHPEMRDFIVPDNEGEAFTFADTSKLSGEAKQYVEETHRAVNDWNNWTPDPNQPMQGKIKMFVDGMASKAGHQESDRQFMAGHASLSTSSPPL
jgi:hypothetical protein